MRLFKLANWLSEGDLENYKQQAEQAQKEQTDLLKMKSEIEKLTANLQQTEKELAQAKAQLQINQGFQIELGETQLKLQKLNTETQRLKKDLFEQQKQFNLVSSQLQQTEQTLAIYQDWFELLKIPVRVVDIQKTLPKTEFDTLWGFGIITPTAEFVITTGALSVKGWVLGKKSEAEILRVLSQGKTILETEVSHHRPAVMQRYPDIPTAKDCGFEFSLAVTGMTATANLHLEAVLADRSLVSLCDIVLETEQTET